jgi:hypothetical protein
VEDNEDIASRRPGTAAFEVLVQTRWRRSDFGF